MKRLFLVPLSVFLAIAFLSAVSAEEKPIKLGVMFISSGPLGGYGINGQRAVEMAVEEINAAGGVLGRNLSASFGDTKLKPEIATELAEKFIGEDKVDFLMGPTSSGVAMSLSEVARKHKKILIVTQAATDALTGAKFNPYVFSTLSNVMMHSRSGAYYMATKPYKKWMCIGPDYNYGHESWRLFREKLKELKPDVEILGETFPKLMAKDFSEHIEQIRKAKPEAVWCPLWGQDAVNFIRQAKETKLFDEIKFAFPVGAALETVVPLGKETPSGLYMSSRYFFTTPDSVENRDFVKKYYEKYKEYPDYMTEETYAGVHFIKAALVRAGTTDPDALVKAVEREPLAWLTPEGWKVMRPEDHQVVEDVVWGETAPSEKYGFAVLTNIQSIQGEQICRTPEELKKVNRNP
ncbi:MAG: ABC transporter substrate-binding protein [Desulfomonile tiedjei]|nr:ABC transporter substrate-binding protein [Desulfomonile tiedjei]